jgi:capsular polysaccharide biosynthesis protein
VIKKTLQKIFKKISYSIFFLIYGKVEKSINCNEDKRIDVKTFNIEKNLSYKIYSIVGGRLYTDRVHDTAILLGNKIVNEPSFQFRQTSDLKMHVSKISDNIVFKKGTPRKLKKLAGPVLSLLTGGAGNNIYWHWLFDVLPRLHLCSKVINLEDISYFLVPDNILSYQNETLQCLNIPKHKIISSRKFRHIKTNQLVITDHPVVTSGDATKDIMVMPYWISKWLKDSFIDKSKKINKVSVKKIYIDRSSHETEKIQLRSIENEDEIKNYLFKNGYIPIKLHETSFINQVKLFNEAESIVGLHGGGFANLAFCKPGTKVIELRSVSAGTPIENLAKKNELNYSSIFAKAQKIGNIDVPNQQGSIKIPISILSKKLEN